MAKKLGWVFDQCRRGLSKQKHYSWGLSTVLSLIPSLESVEGSFSLEDMKEAMRYVAITQKINYNALIDFAYVFITFEGTFFF